MSQETKLGPLMYILFVNDIFKLFKFVKIKIYADDISLYAVVNTPADKIAVQNELNLLHNWVSLWGLKINFDKCKVMHFGRYNNRFDYYIGNHLIIESTC